MNDYEKLLEVTSNKLELSKEFLSITNEIQKKFQEDKFDDFEKLVDDRQDIIDSINLLDEQFVALFEKIKELPNFEKEITNYPKLSEHIQDIKANLGLSKALDEVIIEDIEGELTKVRQEIKNHKRKKVINNKYSMDSMQKVTKENFGIFIDEKQWGEKWT